MASDLEYLTLVLDQLGLLKDITFKATSGEFLLYYDGRLFGGVYDNRLLIKPLPTALKLLPDAPLEKPYEGAKEMIVVKNVDDKEFLATLLQSVFKELP